MWLHRKKGQLNHTVSLSLYLPLDASRFSRFTAQFIFLHFELKLCGFSFKREDLDVVKALLLFGVDQNLKDNQGLTAYELAEQKQEPSIMNEIKSALKMFSSIDRGQLQCYLSLPAKSKVFSRKSTFLCMLTSRMKIFEWFKKFYSFFMLSPYYLKLNLNN